jgi:hypothetical protein
MSYALNALGIDVSHAQGRRVSGADERQYLFRVTDMHAFLVGSFGPPDESVENPDGASGSVNVFSTGARRTGPYGERTWWRIEKPALERNTQVAAIVRRRKDGRVCGSR